MEPDLPHTSTTHLLRIDSLAIANRHIGLTLWSTYGQTSFKVRITSPALLRITPGCRRHILSIRAVDRLSVLQ